MKFTAAAVLAAAAGASAHYSANATVVTEVVDVYTTYCPGPTAITHGTKTYSVTEATTLTITDCPCTITKPVIATPAVVCHTCGSYNNGTVPANNPTGNPAGNPTGAPPANSAVPPANSGVAPVGTAVPPPANSPISPSSPVPTAGAGKAAVLSGAGLAAVVGFAVFVL